MLANYACRQGDWEVIVGVGRLQDSDLPSANSQALDPRPLNVNLKLSTMKNRRFW